MYLGQHPENTFDASSGSGDDWPPLHFVYLLQYFLLEQHMLVHNGRCS
jgi:hypothetical protein